MYADSTADIQGIVMDDDTLLFSVSGAGVVKESSTYVTSGSINEGSLHQYQQDKCLMFSVEDRLW